VERGSSLGRLGSGSEALGSCAFFPALRLESREKRYPEFVGFFAVFLFPLVTCF